MMELLFKFILNHFVNDTNKMRVNLKNNGQMCKARYHVLE